LAAGLDPVGIGAVAGVADTAFGAAGDDAGLWPPATVAVVTVVFRPAGVTDSPAVGESGQISGFFGAIGASRQRHRVASGSEETE
jgi:membrane associated rhomboid family serine protease